MTIQGLVAREYGKFDFVGAPGMVNHFYGHLLV